MNPAGQLELRDIAPLEVVHFGVPWWVYAVVTALLVALGLGLWWWRRARKRARQAPPSAPPEPHQIALAALDGLALPDPHDLHAVSGFHFDISEILRAYVEARFGLNATDLTTEEILARTARLPALSASQRGLLAEILQAADRVKYARGSTSREDMRLTQSQARQLVRETTQQEAA